MDGRCGCDACHEDPAERHSAWKSRWPMWPLEGSARTATAACGPTPMKPSSCATRRPATAAVKNRSSPKRSASSHVARPTGRRGQGAPIEATEPDLLHARAESVSVMELVMNAPSPAATDRHDADRAPNLSSQDVIRQHPLHTLGGLHMAEVTSSNLVTPTAVPPALDGRPDGRLSVTRGRRQ